jgi:hypothetical protein
VRLQVMWNTKLLAKGKHVNREFCFIRCGAASSSAATAASNGGATAASNGGATAASNSAPMASNAMHACACAAFSPWLRVREAVGQQAHAHARMLQARGTCAHPPARPPARACSFSTPDEAGAAIQAMNGAVIEGLVKDMDGLTVQFEAQGFGQGAHHSVQAQVNAAQQRISLPG